MEFFEAVSEITEINEISEFMNDEALDEALEKVIKIISKPDIPVRTAAPLIVQFAAMSLQFKLQAKYYMLYNKSDDSSKKKNTYMSMSEGLDRLVDALKYVARSNG